MLQPGEAHRLIAKDPRNRECLLPYLTGDDLNSSPSQSPSRWVICFFDWLLDRAQQYPDLMRIVEERVKPEREAVKQASEKERWWLFARLRGEMHRAIGPLQRVLVRAAVSDTQAFVFAPTGMIYSHKVIVFALDGDYEFGLLQSTVHEGWTRRLTSTMRTDVNYSPSDCFDTFPFPQVPERRHEEWASRVGATYYEKRRQVMVARNLGLTKTYNLFHEPRCGAEDIISLRDLHAEVDRAILACYGWSDLDPQHSFYPNDRGQTRFTMSPPASREVVRRLLSLNLQVAEREKRSVTSAAPQDRPQ